MEKVIRLILLLSLASHCCWAQTGTTTNGTDAGSSGDYNSFFGYKAGEDITSTGNYNSCMGAFSGSDITTGDGNTCIGVYSGYYITTSSYNTYFGYASGKETTGSYNTFVGAYAGPDYQTGSYNTAVGYEAGPAYWSSNISNSTAIGYGTITTASNQIRIGNSSVTSIGGYVGWSTLSDERYKSNIQKDVSGLELILKLEPVSYEMDKEKFNEFLGVSIDPSLTDENSSHQRQIGLIAQDVERTLQELNMGQLDIIDPPKNENDYYGIRYAKLVVPLTQSVQDLDEMISAIEEVNTNLDVLMNELENLKINSSSLVGVPNPFDTKTTIAFQVDENINNSKVIIYDLQGNIVKSLQVNQRGLVKLEIDFSENESGVYIYSLFTDGALVGTSKLIKK